MCGISGLQYTNNFEKNFQDRILFLDQILLSLKNRGPDSSGTYVSDCKSTFLGHTRLAIQDLDQRADQPFSSSDGRYRIVFNGEIYNFKDLKERFFKSHAFKTSSDTEVLLELFIMKGPEFLALLRGMFAFAIWDDKKKELFLARDLYGIKPLYYIQEHDQFSFASQVGALVNNREDLKKIEPAGVVGFLLMGSVPDPWTIYQNIFSLEKGSYIIVKDGKILQKKQWSSLLSHWQHSNYPENFKNIISDAVQDSVEAHLISDVPVSVFLSGGIDSTAIASLASQRADVTGINISFNEFRGTDDDELPLAKVVAESIGIDLKNKVVTKEEFEHDFEEIVNSIDQPSIDGINTWYASKAAKENGFKVVLSGVGGDEIFCGYPSFAQLPKIFSIQQKLARVPQASKILDLSFYIASKILKKEKIKFLGHYFDSISRLYLFKRANFLPHEILSLIGSDIFEEGISKLENSKSGILNNEFNNSIQNLNSLSQVSFLESNFYMQNQLLRDSDWSSMHHSIELRTPLVDSFLASSIAKFVPAMKNFPNKSLLATATNKPLPYEITSKNKTGFSTPLESWINSTLEKKKWNISAVHINLSWSKKWAIALLQNKFN